MRRRFRAFVVVVAAILAVWGGWWWVQHGYVSANTRPVGWVAQPAGASPQVCMEPDGTVVNNCAEKLASGQVVLVAPAQTTTTAVIQQPAAVQAEVEAASGPCVTPAGAIYAPDCAAPPAAPPPAAGSGGGGGAEPNPCVTPAGAIYSSC